MTFVICIHAWVVASRSKPNYRLTKLNEPYQIGGQKKIRYG